MTTTAPVAAWASAVGTNRAGVGSVVRSAVRTSPSALGLAFDLGGRGALDAQVAPPVVEQRHRMPGFAREYADLADEQVVVAGRERLDHVAFEAGDRTVQERQPSDPAMPRRATEIEPARLHGRPGEAVRQRLLVLGQDVHGVPAGRPDDRREEPAAVKG